MTQRIEDYALIGNCETTALVGRDGSIDWLSLPRFDSAACFAALLGTRENGCWRMAPTAALQRTAPLAGFVGVPASLVVTAYQSASGIMNLFIPTSAVVMGGLAIARVPYGTYLRWVWPLLAALTALCVVVLGVSAVIA